MVRVIAGLARGRRLNTSRGPAVRPTADRVKETLFNVLGPRIPAACFLDLFAGSGAVGIEALSRGAQRAVFVDSSARSLALVKGNLALTGLSEWAEGVCMDVLAALRALAARGERFDLIFLDPPYNKSLVAPVLAAVAAAGITANGAWVVAEHHWREELPAQAGSLVRFRELRFGETMLTLFADHSN